MAHEYKSGTDSTVGENIITFDMKREALIDLEDEQYLLKLSDSIYQPKHFGKTIKRHHYLPLLDDRNINDQGLDANGAVIADGNLWGSSKDIGKITSSLPLGSELGSARNRVGYKRITVEGTLKRFDFFDEYTKESVDFDDDSELRTHITREALRGALAVSESVLQIDLLNSAGVIRYGGSATTRATVSGDTAGVPSILSYEGLMKASIQLDDNKCPKHTKIFKGSKNTDTMTLQATRMLFIGSELKPTIKRMKDLHNNQAFIPSSKYADGSTLMNGEIGVVDEFKIIVHPNMLHWSGAGAPEGTNGGYRATGGNYDVYPALCVGSDSFTTLGFQVRDGNSKFDITNKPPSKDNANRLDPHGDMGFYAIKWYYDTLIWRPEWIFRYEVVAEL